MKTHVGLLKIILPLLLTQQAFAMAPRAPKEPTVPKSTPPVSAPPAAPAPVTPVTPGSTSSAIRPELLPKVDVFTEVSYQVASQVDDLHKSYRELMPQRSSEMSHQVDHCDVSLEDKTNFADRISYQLDLHMNDLKGEMSPIASYYGLSGNVSSYYPVSLIRQPMCAVSSVTLGKTINKVPAQRVIDKMNAFANRYNTYRENSLKGNEQAFAKLHRLWGRMMMCLAYTESLTSANTRSSDRVAASVAPSGYRRPAGVLFYEDPAQSADSKLNLGLYQFTPSAGGNINSCIRQWNNIYPSCQVSTKASQSEMIRVLGSSFQTFNAFCGVNKVIQTFTVQVNTSRSSATHPANKKADGTLKAPADRCVSLHFQAGKAYNHFGPFQNSTGSNLEELMDCTLAAQD